MTSLATLSTFCTASSTAGVFSQSHFKVESLGFSFLGIHDPLLIAALRWQYLYKPSLQDVLEELDLVQFILVLTIVSIGQPPPMSIIASKLCFTLVYLSSYKLWFE
jgi:hypothetical protein